MIDLLSTAAIQLNQLIPNIPRDRVLLALALSFIGCFIVLARSK